MLSYCLGLHLCNYTAYGTRGARSPGQGVNWSPKIWDSAQKIDTSLMANSWFLTLTILLKNGSRAPIYGTINACKKSFSGHTDYFLSRQHACCETIACCACYSPAFASTQSLRLSDGQGELNGELNGCIVTFRRRMDIHLSILTGLNVNKINALPLSQTASKVNWSKTRRHHS